MAGAAADPAAQIQAQTQALVQNVQEQVVATMNRAAQSIQSSFAALVGTQVKQLSAGLREASAAVQGIDRDSRVVLGTLRQLPGSVRDFGQLLKSAGPDLARIGKEAMTSMKQVGAMGKELTQLPRTLGALKEVTNAWKIAQQGVNVAFRSNPIGFVIAIVQKFLPLLINLVMHNSKVREAVEKAFSIIQKVITTVMGIVEKVITAAWPIISKIIQTAVSIISTIIGTVFPAVQRIVQGVITFLQALFQKVWPAIVGIVQGAVQFIQTVITTVFNAVRTVVEVVWNGIKAIITGAVNTVIGIVHGIGQVWQIIKDAFGRAVDAVSGALGEVVRWVGGLPGRVLGALGDFGSTLFNAGKDLIMGLIRGIGSMAGQLLNSIKNFVLDHIPGPIKSILGISSPSRLMSEFGHNIGEGLAQGIDGSGDLVNKAMSKLVPVPKASVAIPALAGMAASSFGALGARVGALGAAAQAAGGSQVAVYVNPQPGQSEYEIGRITAREVAWAGKR
ncbi:phage tail protein [Kutzneria albida]|uniref:Uncharacterized protein n=1 Tax=Kutzneria albida DSM 43870 TaxID=1449976 RepID=W5W9L9_9PSEU|nr:hypothetical protein [Kutzneria albida]AHH97226.1 hypothetical protein KALB_3862 [Kutzneria albida DSM 43870]